MWNDYVLATVAYLERDIEAFEVHRLRLEKAVEQDPSSMVTRINRANLIVLGRLKSCFAGSYKKALSCEDER
jgi:hypothetical protein